VIRVEGLTKRYGRVLAVDDLSFGAEAGRVTGFLGPNGAGKTTTLRVLVGLAAPSAGRATIGGRVYRELDEPARHVGAVLETMSFHPGRSGRNHLRALAAAAGLPRERVEEVLSLVDLQDAARRRAGGYSLGMRQRLGLAAALLGEPDVLVLDEPANGLDPQGIRWLRDLLRSLADAGRSVLLSSHVLAEVAQLADDVVIIHRGRFVTEGPVAEIAAHVAGGTRARSPQAARLAELAAAEGIAVTATDGDLLRADAPAERLGELAAAHGIVLHELVAEAGTLEEAFLELTGGGG
jgi:ABC-2 type transport system ATP-binding protein